MEQNFSRPMRYAVELARRGRFAVSPNPMVGAVLMRKGHIVAEGWHEKYGEAHAEVNCLKHAQEKGIDTKGCTLIVTLEPCKHHGKTPPCVDAIEKAGIEHVVIGSPDPTSEAGGGAEILRQQGIMVTEGVERALCDDLLADFLVLKNTSRPYVILKMASTLDGRIATRTGHSSWISCPVSRQRVQTLRRHIAHVGGAVLIGGGTFRLDNPRLTVRYEELDEYSQEDAQPLACVVSSRIVTNALGHHLIKDRPTQTIFYTSPAGAASPTAKDLEKVGVKVWSESPSANNLPPLGTLLERLRSEMHCPYVLCEGGGKLALSLLEQGLVDEFRLFLAPAILGDNDAKPIFDGRSPLHMSEALSMRITDFAMCGDDVHITLRPKPCSPD